MGKTELLQSACLIASIYHLSKYALRSLGIIRVHFVDMFWNYECHSILVFSKRSSIRRGSFLIRAKGDAFQNVRIRVDVASKREVYFMNAYDFLERHVRKVVEPPITFKIWYLHKCSKALLILAYTIPSRSSHFVYQLMHFRHLSY